MAALAVLVMAALSLAMRPAGAADIQVFTSGAPSAVQRVIAAEFTKTTGHQVVFTAETIDEIRKRLAGDARPDVVVIPVAAMDALEKAGALRPGSRINLARVGIGIAVREGAPLPDVSTVDALRRALLNARSIAHPDPQGGGFAGVQIARMFQRLGIADAVKPKVRLMFAFTGGVAAVAKGDVELGLFNISEILPVKGVALAGPLPPELQSYITFAGAVHVRGVSPEPAAAFLRALTDPKARDAWKSGGFEALDTER